MTGKRIVGLISFLLGMVFVAIGTTFYKNTGNIGVLFPWPIMFIIGIIWIANGSKTRVENAKENKNARKEYSCTHTQVLHVIGQPIAQNTKCEVEYALDGNVTITGGGKNSQYGFAY